MSRNDPPLVPAGLRRVVEVLALASALVVVVLGLVHHGSSGPGAADRRAAAAIEALGPPGTPAYAVDGLVTALPLLVTLAVLVAAGLLAGCRRLALLAVLGPSGVAVVTTLLKPLVGRTIHGDNLSFPSGHTAYATAVGLVIGFLLVALVRPARTAWSGLLLVPAVVAGGVMAVDQVALDAHYPSDTVGGFCTALAVVLGLALVMDQVLGRRGAVSVRGPGRRPVAARCRAGARRRPGRARR